MPDVFDPYYDWLGIPPEDQPADHYRLLGVRKFEANVAAIANAADQRVHLLRSAQIGKRMSDSQKLLNEVAAASTTLLNAERKRVYDQQLSERLTPQVATIPPPVLAAQTLLHSGPPRVVPKKPDDLPSTLQPTAALARHSPPDLRPTATDVDATFKINIPFTQFGGAAIGFLMVVVTLVVIVVQRGTGDTELATVPAASAVLIAHSPAISEVNPELKPEENQQANPAEANPPLETNPAPQAPAMNPAAAVASANTAPVAASPFTAPITTAPVEDVAELVEVNPLAGFATAVTLPKLPAPTETPKGDALIPVALGPCVVPPGKLVVINLKGGETIEKGGKQRLMLIAKDGTALQDWEVYLIADTTSTLIARLGVKDQQLMFQWTPEGAQEPAAALLMNCALDISTVMQRHVVSLRTPVLSEPYIIDFEKPTLSLKWVIENMPDPNKVVVEVANVTGLANTKLDPDGIMEGNGDEAILWTGPSDDAMILGLKLKATPGVRSVSVAAVPQFKLPGMNKSEPYVKRKFQATAQQIELKLWMMSQQIVAIQGDKRLSDPERVNRRALLEQQLGGALEDIEKANVESRHLKEIAAAVSGKAQVNFRVYYLVDDVQIDLLTTAAPTE